MVSADLFHACLDGDLNKVNQLLAQAPPLDIEEKGASPFYIFLSSHISHRTLHPVQYAPPLLLLLPPKDQDGVTPLIAAVKNGHHDVVKALLGHGVLPVPASSHMKLINALSCIRC